MEKGAVTKRLDSHQIRGKEALEESHGEYVKAFTRSDRSI
jgi:hypothetical protein